MADINFYLIIQKCRQQFVDKSVNLISFQVFSLLVKKAMIEYTTATIKAINTKFINVSLAECDLLSISIKA